MSPELQRLRALLAAFRPAARTPALALTVVRPGRPALESVSGAADLRDRIPVRPNTIFGWYSLTKIVTATLALQLHEQSLLNLDDEAQQWVPELALTAPARSHGAEPSLRHLLCHGAGFVDRQVHVARWFRAPGAPFPHARSFLASALRRHGPRRSRPGARLHYSNLGYAVLGEALAAAGGAPFRQLVHERVLAPLGMNHTGFEGAARGDAAQAVGHLPWASSMGLAVWALGRGAFIDGRVGAQQRVRWRDLVFSPHGGLLGPLGDLSRLLALQLGDGPVQVLSDAARQAAAERVLQASGGDEATGLGWWLDRHRSTGERQLRHGGRGPGFTTEMVVLPERRLAVGVLGNGAFDARAVAAAVLAERWD